MRPYMSDQEIRERYRKMEGLRDRVQILADLNGCDKECIKEILGDRLNNKADKEYKWQKTYIGIYSEGKRDVLMGRVRSEKD